MSSRVRESDAMQTRVVVVTDADTPRGAGIARALTTLDAAVVLAGVDTEALAALASELGTAGARIAVFVDDVATESGRGTLVEMVGELFPAPNGCEGRRTPLVTSGSVIGSQFVEGVGRSFAAPGPRRAVEERGCWTRTRSSGARDGASCGAP
jgi:NAD(P)-dependent dehydrogenase (short-subunit alcohol dehydrogenase family)